MGNEFRDDRFDHLNVVQSRAESGAEGRLGQIEVQSTRGETVGGGGERRALTSLAGGIRRGGRFGIR